jgi:DNA repair protein SbcC/Rad50
MILHRLTTKGVGEPFIDREVSIDFDSLPGDGAIIAFVGPNGCGKTHLLEASGPATVFRKFVSYTEETAFIDHVRGDAGFSELAFSIAGERYVARVQCDPAKKKTEAYLIRGEQPIAGPLVTEYDAAIAKLIPPWELFIASVFAAPAGIGSFFQLSKKDRKDLFTAMLGIAHYQELSEAASRRAQEMLRALESVRSSMESKATQAERKAILTTAIAELEWKLETLKPELERLRAEVGVRRQEAAEALSAFAAADASARARRQEEEALHQDGRRVERDLADTREKLQALEATLARRDEILAAVKELDELDEKLKELRRREEDVRAELQPLEISNSGIAHEIQALQGEYSRTRSDLAAAEQYGETAKKRAELEKQISYHEGVAASLWEQYEAADAALTSVEAARDEIREKVQQGAVLRSQIDDREQRKALVEKIDLKHPMCRVCPLTEDGRRAVAELDQIWGRLMELPPENALEEALSAVAATRQRKVTTFEKWEAATEQVTSLRGDLSRLPAPPAGGAAIEELRVTLEATKQSGQEKRNAFTANTTRINELKGSLSVLVDQRGDFEQRRPILAAAAAKASELAVAEKSQRDLAEWMGVLTADQERVREALAAMPPPIDVSDLERRRDDGRMAQQRAEEAFSDATSSATAVEREVARLDGERQALKDPEVELERLKQEEIRLAREVSEWATLEVGLGRDGIQALEIDAAGPGVTALANDLLASCYGPRFSLAIETTAPMKKKGQQKEVFDVRIIDAEAGRVIQQGSQGEGAILDEALRLALSIYNTQRSGYDTKTLWRDEKVGPLDPENANRYMAMLRRAAEIGGFDRILMIAQAPAVWEQADARVMLRDGEVKLAG